MSGSGEQTAVKQLLVILQEIHVSMQTLIRNQERIAEEQQLARKAVAEATVLIANHGIAIATLWRQAGLSIEENDPPPVTN